MKTINLFCMLGLLLSAQISVSSPLHDEVRVLYQQAASQEKSCKKLIDLLYPYNLTNSVLLSGYKACATMMMAKYTLNPLNKLTNFSEGKELLEKAIAADNKNIELRFLRFSVQTKSPSFLGYNKDIAQDKVFLLKSYSNVNDVKLKLLILSFLNESEYLTQSEKKWLAQ